MSTTEEKLQDRIGEISDALALADDLDDTLSPHSELHVVAALAKTVLDSLRCAETVEVESDFDINIKVALETALLLPEAIKLAKVKAKRDEDEEAIDALSEAKSTLSMLIRELKEIADE